MRDWMGLDETTFYNRGRVAILPMAFCFPGYDAKGSDLPPPPPLDTSDYIQCPHCKRKFNEAAADRHIPKCANIKSNKR